MVSTRTKLGSMTKSSAYFAEARRYRLPVDAAYLEALAPCLRVPPACRSPWRASG
jgi:hypothetical protein